MEATRRNLLGSALALSTVAAAGLVPAQAQSVSITQRGQVSPELLALIRDAEQASRACTQVSNGFDAHAERCRAAVAKVPHVTIDMGADNYKGDRIVWSTDNPIQVASAKGLMAVTPRKPGVGSENAAYDANVRRFMAAVKRRDRAVARINKRLGTDAAYDRLLGFEDAELTAMRAVENFPVRSMADLLTVIAFMDERGTLEDAVAVPVLVDGIRRLAGEA